MVKKVVAIEDNLVIRITKGKEYVCVDECDIFYTIINDRDKIADVFKERFKPLEEEMKIKVGSEWVSGNGNDVVTVKYVGEHKVFIKWDEDGSEGERFKDLFLKSFKPKPTRRTVWLNVYDRHVNVHLSKHSADLSKNDGLLFQQEVELIDTREGEVNE